MIQLEYFAFKTFNLVNHKESNYLITTLFYFYNDNVSINSIFLKPNLYPKKLLRMIIYSLDSTFIWWQYSLRQIWALAAVFYCR